jgi:SAM-dependent methyltransferase
MRRQGISRAVAPRSGPANLRALPSPRHHAPVDYDATWTEVYGDMQDVGPVHRHMRRLIGRLLRGLEYRSVLEVGCGAGHNLPLAWDGRHLERVTGVDISEEALSRARERWPTAEFSRLDIQNEQLPDRWDLVFSSLVLEHLPDDVAALEHMRAMTGGHLLVATIGGNYERYRSWEDQVGHIRNYAPGELETKLGSAGFRVERMIRWGFPFYNPLARTLQNRMTSEPSYGRTTRLMAEVMYWLYFLNGRRRGDLLIALAAV